MFPPLHPRVNSYSEARNSQSDASFPGPSLDADFERFHSALRGVAGLLGSVARIGPRLKAGVVTRRSLASEVFTGLRRPVYWSPFTRFRAGSTVLTNDSYYYAASDHVSSGSFAADVAAGKWMMIIGVGNGSPVTDDNFADVQNKPLARQRLGIGTMGVHDEGQDLTEYRDNAANDGRFLRRSGNLADLDDRDAFLTNLGLAPFTRNSRADGLRGPGPALYGRSAANGRAVTVLAGDNVVISGGSVSVPIAEYADSSQSSPKAVAPALFRELVSESAFSFVGAQVIPGVAFGALRHDRSAIARHAPPHNAATQTLTPGAWRTRALSDIASIGCGASIVSGRLRLPAGAYFVECRASTYFSSGPLLTRLRFVRVLREISGVPQPDPETIEVVSTTHSDGNAYGSVQTVFKGLIVSPNAGHFELQQMVSAVAVAGQPTSLDTTGAGAREIFSSVRVYRLDGSGGDALSGMTFRDLIYKAGSAAVVYDPLQHGRQFIHKVGACVLMEPEEE